MAIWSAWLIRVVILLQMIPTVITDLMGLSVSAELGNCGILVHSSVPRRLYSMFPQSIEVQLMHKDAGDFCASVKTLKFPIWKSRRGPKEKLGCRW